MKAVFAIAHVVIIELLRRKDFYVLFVLTAVITLLLGAVNVFSESTVVRYLKEACLLLIWISTLAIAMVTTARQIPAEREHRTIFPLLAKPVKRGQIVLGKFLGCWLACGLSLLCFYLFFIILSASRDPDLRWAGCLQALWLHWCMLAVVVALVLLGSLIFAAPSSNVTINLLLVVGVLFLGKHLLKVALRLPEPSQSLLSIVYFTIPHLEFFDVRELIIHDWGTVPWAICGLASLYAAAYAALFLFMAWMVFRKKPLH
jgi:ABC-type transport system involved in multi-copper enzyme maturation permease subunit